MISIMRQYSPRLSALALAVFIVFASPLPSFADQSKRVDAKTASKMIETGAIDMILDVRDIDEYSGPDGRIRGAQLVPLDKIPASMDKLASFKDKTLLVYCAVGGRSNDAARYLASKGFNNVFDLSGGIYAWKAAGMPVVK